MKKHLFTSLALAITLLGSPLIHAMDQEKSDLTTSTILHEHKQNEPETETLCRINNKPNKSINHFSDLPDEVILEILSYLNFETLLKVAQVNKSFARILKTRPALLNVIAPKLYDALINFACLRPLRKSFKLSDYFAKYIDRKLFDWEILSNFKNNLSQEGAIRKLLDTPAAMTWIKPCLETGGPLMTKILSLIEISLQAKYCNEFFGINFIIKDLRDKEASYNKSHEELIKFIKNNTDTEAFKHLFESKIANNEYSTTVGRWFRSHNFDDFNDVKPPKFLTKSTLIFEALKNNKPGILDFLLNHYLPDDITGEELESRYEGLLQNTNHDLSASATLQPKGTPEWNNLVRNYKNTASTFETLVQYATKNGYHECLDILLKKGADWKGMSSEYLDSNFEKTFKNFGEPALTLAVISKNIECVKILLKKHTNKDVNVLDSQKNTPLHNAAKLGFTNILEILLKNEATLNVINPKTKETPLFLAAKYGHRECVKLLLDYGADTEILTVQNQTAFDVAKTSEIMHMIAQKNVKYDAAQETAQTQASLDNTPFVHLEELQPLASPELEPLNAPLAESDDCDEPQSKRQRIS